MTIVVATDFSENSQQATRLGAAMASFQDREMVLIHVVDLASNDNAWRVLMEDPEAIEKSAIKEAQQKLESFFEETVEATDRPSKFGFSVRVGNPIDELLAEAKTLDDPLIIAGTRGRSRFQEFFLGSTAHRLVRQIEGPVILVPPDWEVRPLENILVAMDYSAASREALRQAAQTAREHGAALHLVNGVIIPEVTALQASMASVTKELGEIVADRRRSIEKVVEEQGVADLVSEIKILQMSPAMAIRSAAQSQSVQMIFMGSHGRRGWTRFFLGNTAERVMRRVPCPLYLVRVIEE